MPRREADRILTKASTLGQTGKDFIWILSKSAISEKSAAFYPGLLGEITMYCVYCCRRCRCCCPWIKREDQASEVKSPSLQRDFDCLIDATQSWVYRSKVDMSIGSRTVNSLNGLKRSLMTLTVQLTFSVVILPPFNGDACAGTTDQMLPSIGRAPGDAVM